MALYVTGEDFSVSAAIGFISLAGVAVMDGILNITYFRELLSRGMSFDEAIFNGAEQRMRPMLMTALSAGVGLFPAADLPGHRQPGAASAGDGRRGRHADRPDHAARRGPALRKIFLKAYTRSPERVPQEEVEE